MRSKYIGETINGFEILGSHCKRSASGKYNSYFVVKCTTCGKVTEKARNNLLVGDASCECSYKNASHNVRGMSDTRLNKVYRSLIERCENPKCKAYKYYGGRGISVCAEWKNDYQAFYKWAVENGYSEEILPNGKNKLTIDRINNDGNYEPSNCRWVTMAVQNKNKRKGDKK